MIAIERAKPNPLGRGISASKSQPFANARGGKYTHRVRHVTLYDCIGKAHLAVRCWCGYTVFVSEKSGGSFANETSERPICATCEGRAIGAGKDGAREINGKPVMFSGRALDTELDDETEHDCTTDGHQWKHFDDSFDHEFGTEIDVYRMCEICGKHEQGPFHDDDLGDFDDE